MKKYISILIVLTAFVSCQKQNGFVLINGGTFTMGSPDSELDRFYIEGPQHQVTVNSFYMGKYEVTQKEYKEIMDEYWNEFKGGTLPIESVNWYDAIEYCNRRSQKEGLAPAYTIDKEQIDPNNESQYDERKWTITWDRNANGYRLPTEAEWEYACRAGTTTTFNTGKSITSQQANYNGKLPYYNNKGTYREKPMPVGSFKPNSWGLYDMHGNVWEWCWDWYGGDYSSEDQVDPVGMVSGQYKILRGGAWSGGAVEIRSAFRYGDFQYVRYPDIGLRLVRNE